MINDDSDIFHNDGTPITPRQFLQEGKYTVGMQLPGQIVFYVLHTNSRIGQVALYAPSKADFLEAMNIVAGKIYNEDGSVR